jgi:2-polyprenyl-6-methoxyphenol hydroxylase-like FAD-dependent oxidoreductase
MATRSESTICFAAGKKIVVAGAGISGLAFVAALRKLWQSHPPSLTPPSITIYERDPKDFGAEREGYSISIRSDGQAGGMRTLKNLGLLDQMLRESITGIQENPGTFVLWDRTWRDILRASQTTPKDLPVPSMRIARNVLRRTLIEAVSESDKIHWAIACTGAVKLSNGRVGVQLSNGKMEECDLLIAADGSKSKIRQSIRPDDKLNFAGAVAIMGNARFSGDVPQPANRDWGLCLEGDGTGLFISPIDEHSAVWSLSYLSTEPRKIPKQPLSKEQSYQLLQEALERGKSFTEPFQTLVKATDIPTLGMVNTMDKQPFPHTGGQIEETPIVFIGDANHAVSPFAGAGANMALMDGWDLAEQLSKHDSLSSALADYDALSMPRSKAVVRSSHWAIGLAHAQGWKLILYIFVCRLINRFFLR